MTSDSGFENSDLAVFDKVGLDEPPSNEPRSVRQTHPEALASTLEDAPLLVPQITINSPPAAFATDGRRSAASTFSAAVPPKSKITGAPRMAPGIGGPNIELPPRLRHFEASRLAPSFDIVPPPPIKLEERSVVGRYRRSLFAVIMAATVVLAITLMPDPHRGTRNGGISDVGALGLDGRQPGRLLLSQRGFTNEPIPLGVSLKNGAGREFVTLMGIAQGTRFTAGAPLGSTAWQMPARDLSNAFALAPKDFVGVMDTTVNLLSPHDRAMDSRIIRLEWIAKRHAPLVPRRDPPNPVNLGQKDERIAMLIQRAEDFFKTGDIVSARIALRIAANSSDPQALLTMGATFDPKYLEENGVLGFAADVPQARAWYGRAVQAGSAEALRRLERLNRNDTTQ